MLRAKTGPIKTDLTVNQDAGLEDSGCRPTGIRISVFRSQVIDRRCV
jgi:hypothetical protein